MTSNTKNKFLRLLSLVLLTVATGTTNAALTDLGNAPLISATTSDVLPNLMYILDNSGSMASEFMPDYVTDSNKCKTTGTSGAFSANCSYGHPPYNSKDFNSIYYNPEITYTPGTNADGTSKISMTSANTSGWTSVPIDAYRTYSTSNTRLVPNASRTLGYPDIVWCNQTSGISASDKLDPTQCKQNSQYIYPNNTGTQSTSFNQSYELLGYPFYYTVTPGEYCTEKELTNCIVSTVPSGAYTFPATLRWCNSAARTSCKAKFVESTGYTFVKWSGINSGTQSTGKIKINADTAGCGGAGQPVCAAPSAINITNITVDGTRIIVTPTPSNLNITDTTSNTQRNTLATNIATAINGYTGTSGFTASSSGDEVTLNRVAVGAFMGTIDVTANSVNRAAIPGVQAQGEFNVTKVGKDQSTSTANNGRCNNASSAATNCPVTVQVTQVRVGNPSNTNITSGTITYNTNALNSASGGGNTTKFALATLIKDNINTTISSPFDYTATCGTGTSGSGVTCTTDQITITAVTQGTATHGAITITSAVTANAAGSTSPNSINTANLSIGSVTNMGSLTAGVAGVSGKTYTIPTLITQFSGGTPVVNTFNRVDIEPATLSYVKALSRTDCAGSTCTYDEEMTNFANWYSYYRTRMQMMKTSTSHAFKTIDTRFRVGFITINSASSNYLPIAQYTATQKTNWYNKLFAAGGNSSTPLRTALSTVGRIYAGKNPVSGFTSDPVQYSCQQNFTILTTDGYWNGGGGLEVNGSTAIGNFDGDSTGRPQHEGPIATSNTLADAAKYYYDTDLRNSSLSNCTGGVRPNGTTGDVCANNVFVTTTDNNLKQHMTTFTLGLGVDGTLEYTPDYKTAESGDFYELKQNTLDWPVPVADEQTAVDDLWHTAVNGQGTYFSAKNPNQLASSLSEALNSIKAKTGAGAAAATSTLNPVSGDNFTYVASYTSVKWIGNLEARTVNTDSGKVSEDATWCLENVIADTCAQPSNIVALTTGSSTTYQCVTPDADTSTCSAPGVLDGTDCKVEISTSCTGTMQSFVSNASDTRNVFMNVAGNLGSFTTANLATAGKDSNYKNAFLAANLSQWNTLTTAQRALVNETSLVNFLRGNSGYEDRVSNLVGTVDKRIYRLRETVLGDLIDSTPVYVGVPKANFSDPGYGPNTSPSSFKTAQATRTGTVYIGSNDGMLHAINAVTGTERWAYMPTMVLDNMWKLADKNYGNGVSHSYYVNGDIVVNDVCAANCTSATTAVWKTILVAGLNGGGRGYFALDITTPNSPTLLWEFDPSDDSDIGYTYGNPVVTKKSDGTWVVVFTSGYNNTTGSNPGKGFLYVVNAASGAIITKYTTGTGDATTPSGLSKLNAYVRDGLVNNTAEYVYTGDLLGNLWRFDINTAASATNPFKVALLKDPSGNPQPITVRPELAEISGKRVLYVGTGRYLGVTDLSDTQQQTIYAISDSASATLDNPRTSSAMVSQVLVNNDAAATRSVQSPSNTVSFASGRGWYIDFPDTGERQNVPAQLVFGTLLLPTTVPSNTLCSPGGYGWLNFLDYRTGAAVVGNVVASKTNAPIVGINVLYVKGKPVVNIVTADNPTPQFPPVQPTFTGGSESGFTNHRAIWRELIDEQ